MLDTRKLTFHVCKEPVTIKEGDGNVDKILLRKNRKFYEATSEYLAALTQSIGKKTSITKSDIMDLVSGDQTFLSIECYKLNYGDIFEFEYSCPDCNEPPGNQFFDLTKLPVIKLPQDLDTTDPTISLTLPRSKKTATVGMLNGHKEAILIEQILTTGADLNQGDFLSLRELDGSKDFSYEDVVKLPLADHKAIRGARKKLVCGYDTIITVTCDTCGSKNSRNVVMHKDFLLPTG